MNDKWTSTSKKGEKFVGLDEKEYTLDNDMIVICDEKKIINMENVSKNNSIKLSIGKKNHLKVKII